MKSGISNQLKSFNIDSGCTPCINWDLTMQFLNWFVNLHPSTLNVKLLQLKYKFTFAHTLYCFALQVLHLEILRAPISWSFNEILLH